MRNKSTEELINALNESELVRKVHPLGDYPNISRYSYLENISKRDHKYVKSEEIEKTVTMLSELIWQVNRRLENNNSIEEYDELYELTETNKELNNLRVIAQRSRLKLALLQLLEILISGLIYVGILWLFYKGLSILRNDAVYILLTNAVRLWVSDKLGHLLLTVNPVFTLAIGILGIALFHVVVKNFLKSIAERTVSLLDDFVVVLVAQPATTILLIELLRYIVIQRELFGNFRDLGEIVFNIARVLIFVIMGFGLFDGLVIRLLRERAEKTETKLDDNLIEIVRRISLGFIIMIGLIYVLSQFTWNQNDLITAIASAIFGGVVIYAGRNVAENMIAGIYLTLARPFEEGNYIIFNEKVFFIDKVDVTTTQLYDLEEQTRVMIPNLDLASKPITNLSVPDLQHRLFVHLYIRKDRRFDPQPILLKTLYLYPDVHLANMRVMKEEMTSLKKEIPTLSRKCAQIETHIERVQQLRSQLSFYQAFYEKIDEQNDTKPVPNRSKYDNGALSQITHEISEIKRLAQQLANISLARTRSRRVLREISKEPIITFEGKVTQDGWMYTEILLYFTISNIERQPEILSSIHLETQKALERAGINLLPGRPSED
jgi:MscS family membrane protein